MTNNRTEKFEKVDFSAALEDGLMTCLEHEKDAQQTARLVSLLTTARNFETQDSGTDVPPAGYEGKKENVEADYALRAAEQYRQYHRSFCKSFVRELIQHHIYTANNSTEWERLDSHKRELTLQLKACNDPQELKNIMRRRDFVMGSIESLLITRIYYGALQDSLDYPDTLDELRCMFGEDEKPVRERFNKAIRTELEY